LLKEAEFSRVFPYEFVPTELVLGSERFHASAVELAPGLQPVADIIILKSHREADAYLERLNRLLLGLGLMAIIAGAVLIFLISDTVTRPLESLVKGVHALARGDMEYPLEASGHDELSELTRAFDGMRDTLERNETQREQLEGPRLRKRARPFRCARGEAITRREATCRAPRGWRPPPPARAPSRR